MSILSDVQKDKLRKFFKTPEAIDYSDHTIAKMFKISQPTVSKYRKEFYVPIELEFVKKL